MSIQKITVRAGTLVACAVLLTACNDNPSDSPSPDASTNKAVATAPATPASSSSDGGTAAPAPGSGSGVVPNGTKLKSLLPTASHVPIGWMVDDSSAFDTGSEVKSPGDPLLPSEDCAGALTNGGAKTLTSDYQAAYAMTGLKNPNSGSSTVVFNGYQPGDAVKQMAEVSTLVKRCASFTTQDINGAKVKMSAAVKPVAGLGEQALDIKVTPRGSYVADDIVLVRSGNVIMAVDEDDSTGKMAPLVPVAKKLAAALPPKS